VQDFAGQMPFYHPINSVKSDHGHLRWSLPSPTDPVWWRLMHAISS